MVYKAQDYINTHVATYSNLEAGIDKKLQADGKATLHLDIYTDPTIKAEVIRHITKVYEGAGWKVTRQNYDDFREHWDYLQITLK